MLTEYKDVFLEELEEQLQVMDDCILELEREGGRAEIVQNLFRAAHTLKGSSAAMGFEEMKRLTHQMEHLLDQVRSGAKEVTTAMADLLFKALDTLKLMKSDIEQQDHCTVSIGVILQELEAFAVEKPELEPSLQKKAEDALDQGLSVYWLSISLAPDCVIQGARAYVIRTFLEEWGEVMEMSPDPDELGDELVKDLRLSILYAGSQEQQELQAALEGLVDVAAAAVKPYQPEESGKNRAREDLPEEPHSQLLEPAGTAEELKREEPPSADKAKTATVRVSVERLDHLMNLVGELVIDQTRIHQIERRQRALLRDESVGDLGHVSDHLTRIISELQDSVMKARMLPIEQLFNRFPRMIRDLSRHLGKEVDLVMEGKDTELDRTLIEEIADPLIHLLRNAVDHGLEEPERRARAGKPEQGTLTIRAAHEDNQVVICVEDDGAGIDPEQVKASALRKGIIQPEEAAAMTDKEAVELIFRPGFSTAQAVSDISGRGVGMDIVRSHIEKLNGLIDIRTRLGEGTIFKIRLPLTLAIITGLMVKTSGQTLIVPMSNIVEIVRVTGKDVENVRGRPVLVFREQVLPVVGITNLSVQTLQQSGRPVPVLIVGYAEKRLALAVDELIGNQEIVVKSLGSYVGKVEGIAGATILGDGRVALILEIAALFNQAGGFRY
ncbi:chemotaxis protein CheA [Paenibacillus pinistramenti]|uniref:chemotaxis protein CheA n=1 Tax=Paenibacillus pinistramenti TaxID=1768003 RepID=UPI001108B09A|nr:chemotaxis protein CheA [Paenibacillus pinistramenti]